MSRFREVLSRSRWNRNRRNSYGTDTVPLKKSKRDLTFKKSIVLFELRDVRSDTVSV